MNRIGKTRQGIFGGLSHLEIKMELLITFDSIMILIWKGNLNFRNFRSYPVGKIPKITD